MRVGIFSTALAALIFTVLTGCASQRTLIEVREDADRAFERGNYQVAAVDYQEVADRKPSDWRSRAKLAKTLLILNRPGEAVENAAVAQRLRSDREELVELYSRALFEAGQHDTLLLFLRERAQQRQGVGDWLRLGAYAARVGDADLAERALLTAARLDAGTTMEPQMALAEFYASIGDDDQAVRRLRMALWLDPGNESVRRRLRAFGEIPGPSLALKPAEAQ